MYKKLPICSETSFCFEDGFDWTQEDGQQLTNTIKVYFQTCSGDPESPVLPLEAVDVERCYSSDQTLTWLQSKQIHLAYKQQTYVDWQVSEEIKDLSMNALGSTNTVLEYQVNWTERMSNPLPYESGIQ